MRGWVFVVTAVLAAACSTPGGPGPQAGDIVHPELVGQPQLRFCIKQDYAARGRKPDEILQEFGKVAKFDSLKVLPPTDKFDNCDLIVVLIGSWADEYSAVVSAYTGRNAGPPRPDDGGRPYFKVRRHFREWAGSGLLIFDAFRPGSAWYSRIRAEAAAAEELRQAVDLAPWWPEAYYNLGLIQASAKCYDEAISNLKLYLVAAPQAEDAAAVRSKVYELEVAKELSYKRKP